MILDTKMMTAAAIHIFLSQAYMYVFVYLKQYRISISLLLSPYCFI